MKKIAFLFALVALLWMTQDAKAQRYGQPFQRWSYQSMGYNYSSYSTYSSYGYGGYPRTYYAPRTYGYAPYNPGYSYWSAPVTGYRTYPSPSFGGYYNPGYYSPGYYGYPPWGYR